MTKSQDSIVFDARYANGSRIPQAAGSAVIVAILNTSTIPAAWSGTLLPLADNVLDVYINGCGRRACCAVSGHYTNSGTPTTIRMAGKVNHSPNGVESVTLTAPRQQPPSKNCVTIFSTAQVSEDSSVKRKLFHSNLPRVCRKQCKLLALATGLVLIGSAFVTVARAQTQRRSSPQALARKTLPLQRLPNRKPRNVVFILTDDQRYDALGFKGGQSFLKTPNLDALTRAGVYLPNAFVTTALCSPSRASILTGMYAHRHRVVDNDSPLPNDLMFFPQYLQRAGYETAFVGKWHMGGHIDHPQPGFNHWVSFKGQGSYLPGKDGFNVDGKPVPQKGYITDELTDYALEWLNGRTGKKPFMLYLSHKAVHAEFIPAERHRGRYQNESFVSPKTMNPANVAGAPMWVQNQRNSWHGVEFPYHSTLDIAEYYKRYAETMLAVDEGLGRLLDLLKAKGWLDSTLIIFMGDNGFSFGEHGLIDKRTAYEESMRVPMVMQCPELFRGGSVVPQVVANIDIAPTILEAAGLKPPDYMDGKSFLSLAQAKPASWRDFLLYEYYWEWPFPQTPTMFALRGDQYKYIHYYGVWDTNELYDIKADPLETRNLITSESHQQVVNQLRSQLFEMLKETSGMYIPLYPARYGQQNLRREGASKAADFPPHLIKKSN